MAIQKKKSAATFVMTPTGGKRVKPAVRIKPSGYLPELVGDSGAPITANLTREESERVRALVALLPAASDLLASAKPDLTALVERSIPSGKQPDEFTASDYVDAAAAMGRPISARAALDRLALQVKHGQLETRLVLIKGHTTRVWRDVSIA